MSTKRKNRKVTLPHLTRKGWVTYETTYTELFDSYKQSLDELPDLVKAMKQADSEAWQNLIDDIAAHIQSDPKLSKLIRERTKDGINGLSIGEPNWFTVVFTAAFAAGYAVGTACYKLGPCKFVK